VSTEISTTEHAPSTGAIEGIIDCDVHPYFKDGLHDLIPYMTETWRRRLGIGTGDSWTKSFAAAQYVLPLNHLHINTAGAARRDASKDGETPGSNPAFVAEQLLEPYGIARAVLIAGHLFGIGAFPDPEVSATVASAYNEWQRELWLEYDSRFRGAIVVPPQNPEAAAREIDRAGDVPGVVAIFMPLHEIAMGERHYDPIYEAAQRHGLPIIVHPSATENVYQRAPRMACPRPCCTSTISGATWTSAASTRRRRPLSTTSATTTSRPLSPGSVRSSRPTPR